MHERVEAERHYQFVGTCHSHFHGTSMNPGIPEPKKKWLISLSRPFSISFSFVYALFTNVVSFTWDLAHSLTVTTLCCSGCKTLPCLVMGSGSVTVVPKCPSHSRRPYSPFHWLLRCAEWGKHHGMIVFDWFSHFSFRPVLPANHIFTSELNTSTRVKGSMVVLQSFEAFEKY